MTEEVKQKQVIELQISPMAPVATNGTRRRRDITASGVRCRVYRIGNKRPREPFMMLLLNSQNVEILNFFGEYTISVSLLPVCAKLSRPDVFELTEVIRGPVLHVRDLSVRSVLEKLNPSYSYKSALSDVQLARLPFESPGSLIECVDYIASLDGFMSHFLCKAQDARAVLMRVLLRGLDAAEYARLTVASPLPQQPVLCKHTTSSATASEDDVELKCLKVLGEGCRSAQVWSVDGISPGHSPAFIGRRAAGYVTELSESVSLEQAHTVYIFSRYNCSDSIRVLAETMQAHSSKIEVIIPKWPCYSLDPARRPTLVVILDIFGDLPCDSDLLGVLEGLRDANIVLVGGVEIPITLPWPLTHMPYETRTHWMRSSLSANLLHAASNASMPSPYFAFQSENAHTYAYNKTWHVAYLAPTPVTLRRHAYRWVDTFTLRENTNFNWLVCNGRGNLDVHPRCVRDVEYVSRKGDSVLLPNGDTALILKDEFDSVTGARQLIVSANANDEDRNFELVPLTFSACEIPPLHEVSFHYCAFHAYAARWANAYLG